jgi:16S rRNA (guanine966-N2)-methyltransferase
VRIIAGACKGRVLHVPKGLPVRPTTDRAKESLFNILQHRIDWETTRVLDLFSGTGNISLEAASRGACSVTAVDKHPGCIQFIQNTASAMRLTRVHAIKADVLIWIGSARDSWDFIFMDPPYAMAGQQALVLSILHSQLLAKDGILVLEHLSNADYSGTPGFVEKRVYGQSTFSFFTSNANV